MPTISGGGDHSLIINPDNQVYAFGSNDNGQLGVGLEMETPGSNLVKELPPTIVSVSAGGNYSLFLDSEGLVYSCGFNDMGQLGLTQGLTPGSERGGTPEYDSYTIIDKPEQIKGIPPIRAISADGDHALLLDFEGNVYAFGNNEHGQSGVKRNSDDDITVQVPTLLPNLPPIKSISAGGFHSLLLSVDGRVFSFGWNQNGQLGLGSYDADGVDTPTLITYIPLIVEISAGGLHSLFLDESGQVYSCGLNDNEQLGLPIYPQGEEANRATEEATPTLIPDIPPMARVLAGADSSYLLDEDGRVWTFGDNEYGQLGLDASSFTLNERGERIRMGVGALGDRYKPCPILDIPPIVDFSGHESSILLLDENGDIWAFGDGRNGQLGLPGQQIYEVPTRLQWTKGKLPEVKERKERIVIKTSYELIEYFGGKRGQEYVSNSIVDWNLISSSGEDTVIEFVHQNGMIFLAQVNYNPDTDDISEPVSPVEDYYNLFEKLKINPDEYCFRPDLYRDSNGNYGFIFSHEGQKYLIRVHLDDLEISRP